ncbi:hypothetical protein CR513_13648, partial [Mucuna pruriens]
MRLNLDKCVFVVQGEKFLGSMLTRRGVEANPDKCKAIIKMKSPQNMKERKHDLLSNSFASQQPSTSMKIVIRYSKTSRNSSLHPLSEHAINTVVVQEQRKKKNPVYYISKVLQEAKTRYQMIEKLVLALTTLTLLPLLYNHHPHRSPYSAGVAENRAHRWNDYIKLSEFSLKFEPRGVIKSQALVDFIVEIFPVLEEDPWWTLYINDSSDSKRRRSRHLLGRTRASASNNQAEHEALLVGLDLALKVDVRKVLCNGDSQLVLEHIKGTYQYSTSQDKIRLVSTCCQNSSSLRQVAPSSPPQDSEVPYHRRARSGKRGSCQPGMDDAYTGILAKWRYLRG